MLISGFSSATFFCVNVCRSLFVLLVFRISERMARADTDHGDRAAVMPQHARRATSGVVAVFQQRPFAATMTGKNNKKKKKREKKERKKKRKKRTSNVQKKKKTESRGGGRRNMAARYVEVAGRTSANGLFESSPVARTHGSLRVPFLLFVFFLLFFFFFFFFVWCRWIAQGAGARPACEGTEGCMQFGRLRDYRSVTYPQPPPSSSSSSSSSSFSMHQTAQNGLEHQQNNTAATEEQGEPRHAPPWLPRPALTCARSNQVSFGAHAARAPNLDIHEPNLELWTQIWTYMNQIWNSGPKCTNQICT